MSSGANASPDFQDDTDTRTVPESTAVGDPVGDPVTATDTDNDTLTYELDDDVVSTNDTLATDSDLQFFDIDMETGQIEVAQELDYDAVGEGRADGAVAGTYTVIVRATDPSGLADNITVTITAENVNEDPVVTGRAELSVDEEDDDGYTALPDAPGRGLPPLIQPISKTSTSTKTRTTSTPLPGGPWRETTRAPSMSKRKVRAALYPVQRVARLRKSHRRE